MNSPRKNAPPLPLPKKTPPLPPPKRSKFSSFQAKTPSPKQSNSNSPDYNSSVLRKSYPMPSRPPPQAPISQLNRHSEIIMTKSESDSEYDSEESTQYYSPKSKTSDVESSDSESEYSIRTKIVNEILSTEKTYVNLLEKLVTIWYDPIKNQNPSDPIIPLDLAKSLFSNLEIIFNINKQFLEDLEGVIKNWSPNQCVGNVFVSSIPFFKVYKQYINDYSKSIEMYQELLKKKSFKKYIDECMRLSGSNDNLPSYLITPIQRIPRYQLLLTELCKYTPSSHPDYEALHQALEKIKSVAAEINDNKREAENIYHCAEIQNMIVYPEEMSGQRNLVTPTRRFVRSGEFEIFLNDVKSPYNYLVLFNDALLVSKKKKKHIHYYGFLYINRLKVNYDDRGITIVPYMIPKCSLYILIPDNEEKLQWMEGLSRKISEHQPNVEEDELIMPNFDMKSDSPMDNGQFKKKSIRKRFLTLAKSSKVKSELDNSKNSKDDNDIKVNPQFSDELMRKLKCLNNQP